MPRAGRPRIRPRSRTAMLLAALCGAALAAAACGSSTATSVAGPTPPRCQVSISGAPSSFPPAGGTGSVQVTTDRDCTWTATSGAPWISLTGSTSGQGNGTFPFSVAANAVVAPRSANITVNGQNLSVSQQPAPCNFSVSPATISEPSSGGNATVSVQAQSACGWTAVSNVPWISIVAGASGNGNGTVQLAVAANAGDARTGTLTVAGQAVTVSQDAATPTPAPTPTPTPPPAPSPPPPAPQPSCSFSIAPTSLSFPVTGGTGTVTVTTTIGCNWTATSPVSWVTITAGSAGTGSGSVFFTVAANAGGGARTTTLSVAGLSFTVNQAADPAPSPPPPPPPPACSYSIAPTSQSFTSDGGTGSVAVTTTSTCSWTATSGASWVTITSGASGTGNGSVSYTVDPNSGGARSATLTIAGQSLTVNQAALTCTYAVSPTNISIGSSGGTVAITVTTAGVCAWTAVSNDSWMTIQSGASGTGTGTVDVGVAPNTGGKRNGTLTVAGQTVGVHQDSARTASLSGPLNDLTGACPTLQFQVTAVVVLTDSSTTFSRGPCKSIQDGTNVDVQGFYQPDSSVLATQVTLLKL